MNSQKIEKEFLRAYDTVSEAIYRHCYFRVYNQDKAEELMQETFIKAWEYLVKGNKVDNLRALLYKIATNLVIDYVRKKKEVSLDMLQDQGFDPGEDGRERLLNQLDGGEALLKLMELDSEYRDVLILRYVDDMKPKEIAEVLNLSVNVVSVRIHRGTKKLKSLLKE